MSITPKKITGVITLAAVALIGGSYWAGKSTEKSFRDYMGEMAQYGIEVTVDDYRRGIFSATARTTWMLMPSEGKTAAFSFDHSIRHGPLLAFLATSRIRSELSIPKEVTATLVDKLGSDPFGGKTPLMIESTFGWGGGGDFHITSPKVEASSKKGDFRLSWGGLDGDITVGSRLSKFKAKIVMDGLSATMTDKLPLQPDQNMLFQMSRVTFQSNMTKPKKYDSLFVGTSSLVLDKLSVRNPDKNTGPIFALVLENARGETSTAIADEMLNAKIQFDVDSLALEGDPKTAFAFNKLGATLLYENLDANAMEALAKAAQIQNEELKRHRVFLALQEQAEALLKHKPAFSIKDVSAGLPEGVAKGNFRIAYAGNGDINQFSQADLAVDLQISLPRALIVRLSGEQAAEKINSMVNKGILIDKNGFLSIDASFKNNALTLNGKQKPLESLRNF